MFNASDTIRPHGILSDSTIKSFKRKIIRRRRRRRRGRRVRSRSRRRKRRVRLIRRRNKIIRKTGRVQSCSFL